MNYRVSKEFKLCRFHFINENDSLHVNIINLVESFEITLSQSLNITKGFRKNSAFR